MNEPDAKEGEVPRVRRWSIWDPSTKRFSGDYLTVDGEVMGNVRDVSDLEYARAQANHQENPAYHMRPMFYTGSPFADEIKNLVTSTDRGWKHDG